MRISSNAAFESPTGLLSLTVIGVLATSVLVTLPILAPAMSRSVDGGDSATGYLASADMLGSALASLVAVSIIRKFDWHRLVVVALAITMIGNLISVYATSLEPLLLVRLLTGLSNGAALSVVFVGLCHTSSPDRSFGIFVLVQLLLQAALLPLFSVLYETYGVTSLYLAMALLPLPALALVAWLPRALPEGSAAQSEAGAVEHRRGWAIASIAGLGIYFVAPAMIWAFFDPLGRRFDLSIIDIGTALGLSSLAGIAGAAAVLLIGERLPRMVLIATGIAISIIALLPIFDGRGYLAFLAVTCAFNFAWNFTYPYLMGVIAHYDRAGESAVQSLASQLLGMAAGPLLGSALLVSGYDFTVMIWMALTILIVSLGLFIRSETVVQRAISRARDSMR